MKKFFCLFTSVLFVLASCSTDDSKMDAANTTLVSQIVGSGTTISYVYIGNKVSQINNGTSKTVITYSGDFITKEESYTNNVLSFSQEYVYENSKLKSSTFTDGAYIKKDVYVYNTDGTVSYNSYKIDAITKVETIFKSGKYTFSDGNLIRDENSSQTFIYEYDTKNNPFKNVLGFDKFIISGASVNNVVKETISITGSSNTDIRSYQYEYNSDGFPISSIYSWNGVVNSSESTTFKY